LCNVEDVGHRVAVPIESESCLLAGGQCRLVVDRGAGAILALALISSRDSREHSVAARTGDPVPAPAAG
jgi:hypothetical protein